jgi:HEAT repeat protein
MPRLLFALPCFVAVSLAAQVPAAPPVAPAPPTPPSRISWSTSRAPADEMRTEAFQSMNYAYDNLSLAGFGAFGGSAMPVAWAQNDPADSLYRMARDQFSRGDYRRSVELFKSLPVKYPNSAYVADAEYWQAFSLYRIGGTPDLQQALAVLEARKPTDAPSHNRIVPTAGSDRATARASSNSNAISTAYDHAAGYSYGVGYSWSGSQTDAPGLAARIANVLSSRGMASDPAVKRALAAGGNSCDQDDQSVRAEALSALMRNDPATGRQMAAKILASKDDCSVPLRRNAVMLLANGNDDPSATTTLIGVARNDPSTAVRMAAIDYLLRAQGDAAVDAVIEISRTATDKQIQRAAVRSLAQSSSPKARAAVRAVAEDNAADETLRLSVLDGMGGDRMSVEDAAWLRTLYAKTTSARMKERIAAVIGRSGGDANSQWILALLRNEDEPLESRTAALERAGRTMDVAALVKFYDASAERPLREEVMQLLAERKEPAALDKIVDIAKNGTDPGMRREAIGILSRSKDPRASQLLLQLVDH